MDYQELIGYLKIMREELENLRKEAYHEDKDGWKIAVAYRNSIRMLDEILKE